MAQKKDPEAVEQKEEGQKEPYPMLEGLRKVLLASVGAVALAQDEIEAFIDRLVERGELAEKEGRKLVQEMRERRKAQAKKAQGGLDERVEDALHRMNIPTKQDVDTLNERIATLTQKVEELREAQSE
jgi:poly(hydroxyalkanoate) granule-associated protein